jgi:hypothetical protein
MIPVTFESAPVAVAPFITCNNVRKAYGAIWKFLTLSWDRSSWMYKRKPEKSSKSWMSVKHLWEDGDIRILSHGNKRVQTTILRLKKGLISVGSTKNQSKQWVWCFMCKASKCSNSNERIQDKLEKQKDLQLQRTHTWVAFMCDMSHWADVTPHYTFC